MQNCIINEDGKTYLICQCPKSVSYAFISKTGKSFVYRVDGIYLKTNGDFGGKEGVISTYISYRLVKPVSTIIDKHYHKNDLFKYDFGDGKLLNCVKIRIKA